MNIKRLGGGGRIYLEQIHPPVKNLLMEVIVKAFELRLLHSQLF